MAQDVTAGTRPRQVRPAVAALVAFFLYALGNWLLTSAVFPIGTAVAPMCRDVGTVVEALGFAVIALIAEKRPTLLAPGAFLAGPLVLSAIGGAGLWLCREAGSVAGATMSVCALELAAAFVMLAAGHALAYVRAQPVALCVLAGLALTYLVRLCPLSLAPLPALAVFCACQAVVVALAWPAMRASVTDLRRGETPEQLTLTNPFSFLPRNHQLFVSLLLFQTAYGIALSYGEVDNAPLATFAGVAPLLLVGAWYAARRRVPSGDALFGLALLLVMAGFLFAPVSQDSGEPLTSNLLEAGSTCFMLVFWSALPGLARRNPRGKLPLFAWSGFLLSTGVVAGAALGRIAYALMGSGPLATTLTVSAVVLGLAAYGLFGLRDFSFDGTVANLVASPEVEEHLAPADGIDRLMRVAEGHGLTARETEIFVLLAQGRNGAYIQRQLGVSYNTVKTHVAHIYAKLGVHAHQELIDLVEHAG